MEPIILASASPRRQEYFRLLGLPFSSLSPSVTECIDVGEEPRSAAVRLAAQKVDSIVQILKKDRPAWVVGADTIIALDGKIYGKPLTMEDAARILRLFSGKTHAVYSAVALYNPNSRAIDCRSVLSAVTFAPLSDGEIEWYLTTGEWIDAAGAYKIQGRASCFITRIEGSYSSIVGLPLHEFYAMLKANGYPYGG